MTWQFRQPAIASTNNQPPSPNTNHPAPTPTTTSIEVAVRDASPKGEAKGAVDKGRRSTKGGGQQRVAVDEGGSCARRRWWLCETSGRSCETKAAVVRDEGGGRERREWWEEERGDNASACETDVVRALSRRNSSKSHFCLLSTTSTGLASRLPVDVTNPAAIHTLQTYLATPATQQPSAGCPIAAGSAAIDAYCRNRQPAVRSRRYVTVSSLFSTMPYIQAQQSSPPVASTLPAHRATANLQFTTQLPSPISPNTSLHRFQHLPKPVQA